MTISPRNLPISESEGTKPNKTFAYDGMLLRLHKTAILKRMKTNKQSLTEYSRKSKKLSFIPVAKGSWIDVYLKKFQPVPFHQKKTLHYV